MNQKHETKTFIDRMHHTPARTSSNSSEFVSSVKLVTMHRTVSSRSRKYERTGPHTAERRLPDSSSALIIDYFMILIFDHKQY